MDIFRIAYYLVITATLTICISRSRRHKDIRLFIPLLSAALLTEIASDILHLYQTRQSVKPYLYAPYVFYILIEYTFISAFYAACWRHRPIRFVIGASTIVFWMITLYLSLHVFGMGVLPGVQYNIEGVLNIILATSTLFYMPVNEDIPIFRLPVFWISTALLTYHSSIFLVNGSYNFLKKNHHEMAVSVIGNINCSLNYLYYIIISIAFLCSRSTKRS